jgi:hypothetical protein
VTGTKHVNDGAIECEVRIDELVGAVRFELVEEADTFQVLIEPTGAEGSLELRMTRRNRVILQAQGDVAMPAELHRGPLTLDPGGWQHVRFSNVDNVLRFELDGVLVAEAAYEEGVPLEREAATPAAGGGTKHGGQRAGFGGERCRARFRRIRVLRDLYYSEKGDFGVRSPVSLGPNEYFLLGDNSLVSQDSRVFGPVHADELLGRPVAVVWPPGGLRRLASPR